MGPVTEKEKENDVATCPWCHGSRQCAKCEGTGERVVQTRFLHRTQTSACRACEGTGVCQLCKAEKRATLR